jgi:folylpolyglutamate synthase/dihydropteroate synthase
VRSWEQHALNKQQQQQQEQELAGTEQQQQQQELGRGLAGAGRRLQQLQQGQLPEAYQEGLRRAAWPGRSQVSSICCLLELHHIVLMLVLKGFSLQAGCPRKRCWHLRQQMKGLKRAASARH